MGNCDGGGRDAKRWSRSDDAVRCFQRRGGPQRQLATMRLVCLETSRWCLRRSRRISHVLNPKGGAVAQRRSPSQTAARSCWRALSSPRTANSRQLLSPRASYQARCCRPTSTIRDQVCISPKKTITRVLICESSPNTQEKKEMKRRKKIPPGPEPANSVNRIKTHKSPQIGIVILVLLASLLAWQHQQLLQVSSMMLLTTMNCSSVLPNCSCSWRGGKFVADCSMQNLTKVPKNDYYDFLFENSGNNQMPTLNRDIQALNLSYNQIVRLGRMEFLRKKFRNLQKIQLNSNGLESIEPSAFYKLTGLIELDLSDNSLSSLQDSGLSSPSHFGDLEDLEPATTSNKTKIQDNNNNKNQNAESFLNQNLAQLRQLNLEANRLRRIEEFAFSPLMQLRQLYLSRLVQEPIFFSNSNCIFAHYYLANFQTNSHTQNQKSR